MIARMSQDLFKANAETNQWKALAALLVHKFGRMDARGAIVEVRRRTLEEFQAQVDELGFSLAVEHQADGSALFLLAPGKQTGEGTSE